MNDHPSPRPATSQPTQTIPVVVLVIDHRHGVDATVHLDRAAAEAALYDYVQFWWADEIDVPMPEDPSDCIKEYFETVDTEHASICESTLTLPASAPCA